MSRALLPLPLTPGTSSIVSPTPPFLPHLHLLSSIVETVVKLREMGHRVVLVSSGAIGVGLRRMGLEEKGKGLSRKQVSRLHQLPRLTAGLGGDWAGPADRPIRQSLWPAGPAYRADPPDPDRHLRRECHRPPGATTLTHGRGQDISTRKTPSTSCCPWASYPLSMKTTPSRSRCALSSQPR